MLIGHQPGSKYRLRKFWEEKESQSPATHKMQQVVAISFSAAQTPNNHTINNHIICNTACQQHKCIASQLLYLDLTHSPYFIFSHEVWSTGKISATSLHLSPLAAIWCLSNSEFFLPAFSLVFSAQVYSILSQTKANSLFINQ